MANRHTRNEARHDALHAPWGGAERSEVVLRTLAAHCAAAGTPQASAMDLTRAIHVEVKEAADAADAASLQSRQYKALAA